MCPKPKAPAATPPPDTLVTARDGQTAAQSAQRRKRGNTRVDLNSPRTYNGLTIPQGV